MTKNNDAVEVSRLQIKVAGTTLNLTIDEAKKLKGALEELFGAVKVEKEFITVPYYIKQYPAWQYPWTYISYTTAGSSTGKFESNGSNSVYNTMSLEVK